MTVGFGANDHSKTARLSSASLWAANQIGQVGPFVAENNHGHIVPATAPPRQKGPKPAPTKDQDPSPLGAGSLAAHACEDENTQLAILAS